MIVDRAASPARARQALPQGGPPGRAGPRLRQGVRSHLGGATIAPPLVLSLVRKSPRFHCAYDATMWGEAFSTDRVLATRARQCRCQALAEPSD